MVELLTALASNTCHVTSAPTPWQREKTTALFKFPFRMLVQQVPAYRCSLKQGKLATCQTARYQARFTTKVRRPKTVRTRYTPLLEETEKNRHLRKSPRVCVCLLSFCEARQNGTQASALGNRGH